MTAAIYPGYSRIINSLSIFQQFSPNLTDFKLLDRLEVSVAFKGIVFERSMLTGGNRK